MSSQEPTQAIDLMAAFSRRHHKHATTPERERERPAPADALPDTGDSGLLARQSQRLKSAHLRPTIARVGVLAVLDEVSPNCLNVNQILCELPRYPGRATVGSTYRALKDLQTEGLLIRSWNEGRTLYRLRPDDQDTQVNTLVCRCAKRLAVIDDVDLQETLKRLAAQEGFAVSDRPVFTISTVCAGCEHTAGNR